MPGETILTAPVLLQPQLRLRKLVFDYVLGALLLIVFFIPMACIAVAIKLESPGPVFFRQPRIGLNNERFQVWKFRTMVHTEADLNGKCLTLRNDPRITGVGLWLRRWSIDEVPQLFNVMVGEMSLVGPRPHPIEANVGGRLYRDIVAGYDDRHCVKPGMTGWAQVNGWRGETISVHQIEQRVAYDMDYIRNWSLLLDLKIILRTIGCVSGKEVF